MIIIATANNNENLNNIKISLDNSISLGQLLDRDDVRAFFHNASKESILASLVTIDGLDAYAITNASSLTVDNTMELQFDIYGRAPETAHAAAASAGFVTITQGGGFNSKRVSIVSDTTRAGDVLTQDVANFFATTVDTLHNMRILINDVEAETTAVLHDGDAITLMSRKCGDKGACVPILTITHTDGSVTRHAVLAGSRLKECLSRTVPGAVVMSIDGTSVPTNFYDAIVEGKLVDKDMQVTVNDNKKCTVHCCANDGSDSVDMILDDGSSVMDLLTKVQDKFENAEIYVFEVDGDLVPEAFADTILTNTLVVDGMHVTFSSLREMPVVHGYMNMEDDSEEDAEDGAEYAGDEQVLEGPAEDTVGAVTVVLPGGFSTSQVAIRNNVTKLRDVVLSARILNMSAMNESQAQTLVYTVNDVESTLDDKLSIGDVIRMSARKAGDKGSALKVTVKLIDATEFRYDVEPGTRLEDFLMSKYPDSIVLGINGVRVDPEFYVPILDGFTLDRDTVLIVKASPKMTVHCYSGHVDPSSYCTSYKMNHDSTVQDLLNLVQKDFGNEDIRVTQIDLKDVPEDFMQVILAGTFITEQMVVTFNELNGAGKARKTL